MSAKHHPGDRYLNIFLKNVFLAKNSSHLRKKSPTQSNSLCLVLSECVMIPLPPPQPWGPRALFLRFPGVQPQVVMVQGTWLETTLPTEGKISFISEVGKSECWQQWPVTSRGLVLFFVVCIFSLSGCPRARKGSVKMTPTKEEKEDPELKWVW